MIWNGISKQAFFTTAVQLGGREGVLAQKPGKEEVRLTHVTHERGSLLPGTC